MNLHCGVFKTIYQQRKTPEFHEAYGQRLLIYFTTTMQYCLDLRDPVKG